MICLAVLTDITIAQSVKRYTGTMMLPSDLDQIKGVVNRYNVGGEGYYDYYEDAEENRVKHGKFYLKAKGYDIKGSYSHGKKEGLWTITHPDEKGYIKTFYNSLKITYNNDVLCGPCEYITKSTQGQLATVTITCNFNNGILTGDASVLYKFDSNSKTSECHGKIDPKGLLHGNWIITDKGGIEIVQKRLYYKGAIVFIEEKDYSTGENTVCYSAFENLKKAPELDQISDTIINGQNCIVYNNLIAIKTTSYRYPSHVRSSVFCIIDDFPDSMGYSVLLSQQRDSWGYAYSSMLYEEMVKKQVNDVENQEVSITDEKQREDSNEVFQVVEEMPDFPGGTTKLTEYLAQNIEYPQEALVKCIQGRVFVNFIVEPDSTITNVSVVRSLGYGCDEEALRVVKMMPKWKPGKQHGKNVRVGYILPINFKLPK